MSRRIGALSFAACMVLGWTPTSAQSQRDLASMDIAGLRLGQTLEEARAAIAAFDPSIKIETRRIDIKKFDPNCMAVVNLEGPEGNIRCGGWNDGLEARSLHPDLKAQGDQTGLDAGNSIIAGLFALNDTREFKVEWTYKRPREQVKPEFWKDFEDHILLSGDMEALRVVVSPRDERVIGIARTKTYSPGVMRIKDLLGQLRGKYGPTFSDEGDDGRASLESVIVKGQIVDLHNRSSYNSLRGCINTSVESGLFTKDWPHILEPALPRSAESQCGVTFLAFIAPDHRDKDFAAGFTMYIVDQLRFVRLSRDRALVIKRMLDAQPAPSPSNREKL